MSIKENVKTAKVATESMVELCESKKELCNALKATTQDSRTVQKLWREGNKSKLMSIGMAVFLFPEPTPISEVVGAGIMAAGLVQKAIKNQGIYAEDIPKTLKSTFKELQATKYDLRI
jgi:hypothetical protein